MRSVAASARPGAHAGEGLRPPPPSRWAIGLPPANSERPSGGSQLLGLLPAQPSLGDQAGFASSLWSQCLLPDVPWFLQAAHWPQRFCWTCRPPGLWLWPFQVFPPHNLLQKEEASVTRLSLGQGTSQLSQWQGKNGKGRGHVRGMGVREAGRGW